MCWFFFPFALRKTVKVCKISCLDFLFIYRFISDIISNIRSSIILKVRCNIIASGINVIIFLRKNTTAQTDIYFFFWWAYFINMASLFECPIHHITKLKDMRADKREIHWACVTKAYFWIFTYKFITFFLLNNNKTLPKVCFHISTCLNGRWLYLKTTR